MRIINACVDKFPDFYAGKKVICFGAGDTGKVICESFMEKGLVDAIDYFVDNDAAKWEKTIKVGDNDFTVCAPDKLKKEDFANKVLFITSRFWDQIVEQLEHIGLAQDVECYVYMLFKLHAEVCKPESIRKAKMQLIPKKLHYCWFGKGNLPEFAVQCIDSWKKYCPDYEIIEWNEKTYNVYKNRFTKEVYEYGHYSALSSYARFDIIHQYGGIYLDTDVEVVRNLDDLLYQDAFMGFEVSNYVNSGHGFGGKKRNAIFAENVEIYDNMTFYNEKGEFHYKNAPSITTEMLIRHGLKMNGKLQQISDITIYPSDYFDPALQIPTETCFSVHKYSSLWSFKGKDMQTVWQKQREYYERLRQEGRIEERV